MKTIIDYLKKHKQYVHDFQGRAFDLELTGNKIILQCNDNIWVFYLDEECDYESEIQNILEDNKIEIRFCEECGKPFDKGYIAGDGDWYCCENCFEDAMDTTYGKGKWRPSDEEGEYGGWYENLDGDEWVDTGIYYTEWY